MTDPGHSETPSHRLPDPLRDGAGDEAVDTAGDAVRDGAGRSAGGETAPEPRGLTVDDVTVRFGAKVAVDAVSLDLPAGQVLAVLGPSGCGKSTLLRAVAGLEPLSAGRISYAGRDLAGVPAYKRGFAMMFQDGQLFAHRDVAGNVGYPLGLRGVRGAERAAHVAELLELVGLPGYESREPATLSGGEQQRVALARSLAADPALLLLDEPLSALDRSLRERLAADLRTILTTAGTTALLVTHDHDEAFTVADRMAVMLAGRVVQHGETAEVWRRPATEDVARFLGYSTVLAGDDAQRVAGLAGVAELVGTATPRLAMRRSALWLTTLEKASLRGTVTAVVAASDAQRVEVDIPELGAAGRDVQALADAGEQVHPGQEVGLAFDAKGLAPLPA